MIITPGLARRIVAELEVIPSLTPVITPGIAPGFSCRIIKDGWKLELIITPGLDFRIVNNK